MTYEDLQVYVNNQYINNEEITIIWDENIDDEDDIDEESE